MTKKRALLTLAALVVAFGTAQFVGFSPDIGYLLFKKTGNLWASAGIGAGAGTGALLGASLLWPTAYSSHAWFIMAAVAVA